MPLRCLSGAFFWMLYLTKHSSLHFTRVFGQGYQIVLKLGKMEGVEAESVALLDDLRSPSF